jgi:hypothetical protein
MRHAATSKLAMSSVPNSPRKLASTTLWFLLKARLNNPTAPLQLFGCNEGDLMGSRLNF